MKEELITVIVPVYNVEPYLNKCIESIVNQTYLNLEILLIDDGSTDNCGCICDSWMKKDSRIKVIHKVNSGVSSARNDGVKIATGKYIGFVDSDDFIDKDMYKVLYTNMINTKSDISMCNYKFLRENKVNYRNSKLKDNPFIIDDLNIFFDLLNKNYYKGFMWNKLFKTDMLKSEKFEDNIYMCEDLLMISRLAIKSKRFCYDNNCLYNYYIRENSAYNSKPDNKSMTAIKAYEMIIEILEKNNVNCIDEYRIELFNWTNSMIHEGIFKSHIERKEIKRKEKQYYRQIMLSSNIDFKKKIICYSRYRLYYICKILKSILKLISK